MSLELVFTKHTDGVWSTLRKKHEERRNDNNAVVRAAIPMPFEKQEFVAWVRAQFKGNIDAPIPCFFCRRWIDSGTYSLDHDVPFRDCFDSTFANLRLCCLECNLTKGDMRGEVFIKLRLLLDREFSRQDVARILSRLKMGGGYKRLAFIQRKQAARLRPAPPSRQRQLPEDF